MPVGLSDAACPMNHDQLKTRQRAERHAHPPNLALRVHRAISWLHRAEQLAEAGDKDGEFIFLWIAFNAAYATEIDERYRLSSRRRSEPSCRSWWTWTPAASASPGWSGRRFPAPSVDGRAILTRYGGQQASKIDHPVPCAVYRRRGHWGVVRGNDWEDPPTAAGARGVDQRHRAGVLRTADSRAGSQYANPVDPGSGKQISRYQVLPPAGSSWQSHNGDP